MSTIGGFSFDDAAEIKRRVLGSSAFQKPLDNKRQLLLQADTYYVRLEQDLPAATEPLTGYTQALARIARYVREQDSLDREVVGGTQNPAITITNRDITYSAKENDVIQVRRIGAEWAPAGAGVSVNLIEGLAYKCLGDGWYQIELATFDTASPDEYADNCDDCSLAGSGEYLDDCASILTFEPLRDLPVGTKAYVYAHDARGLKIRIGGHVRMLPIHKDPETGEQLYAVISAQYEMLKVPVTDWECCNGNVIQTRCDFLLIEGTLCEVWQDECYP